MSEIIQIAARLSAGQREALLCAEPDGSLGKHFVRSWCTNHKDRRWLVRSGMGTAVWSGVMLSETGLTLAQYLRSQDHG